MAHDSNRDFISLRESVEDTTRNNIDPRERYVVSKLDRYELEDRYLRLLDEVNTLKVLSNDQEDKLKKLATKLMRATTNLRPCSVALEVLEDKNKITTLEAENSKLKQRLSVLKNQLLSHTSITSKPSSRIRTPQLRPSSGQITRSESSTMKQPSYHSMLVSNSSEEKHFFEELEEERNEMRDRIAQLEKDLCHCSANNQREKAAENVEYIKVWRQMQQLNDKVISATDTNDALNAQINELKSSLEEATKRNQEITQALVEERKRIADIDEQLMKAKDSEISLREKDEQIKDLMNELKILQQLNNELIALSKKYGQIEKENRMLKKKVSEQLQDQQTLRSTSTDEQATITALQSANDQLVEKLSLFQDNIDNLSLQLAAAQSQKESKEVTPVATQTPSEHTISSKELSATYVDSRGQLYTEAQLAKQCQQCCELLDNFEPLVEEEEEKVDDEVEKLDVEEEKIEAEMEKEKVQQIEEPGEVERSESEKCHKCCQLMEKIYLEKRITSSEMCRIMYEKAVQTDYVAMSDLQMPIPSEPTVTTSTQAIDPGQDDNSVGQQESPALSPNEMLELLDKVQINTPLEAVSLSRKNSRIPSTEAEISLSRKGTSSTIGSVKLEGEQSRKSSSGTSTSIKPTTVERTPSDAVMSHHSDEILSPEPESDETLSSPSDAALQSDAFISSQSDAEPVPVSLTRREASTTTDPRQSRPRWKTNGITVVPCENMERKPLSKIVEESKPSSDEKADTNRKRSSVKNGSSNAKRHRRSNDIATTKPIKTTTPPSSPRKSSTKNGSKKSTEGEKSKPSSGSPDSPRRLSSSMFKSSVPGGCTCSCTERTGIPCTSQSMPVKNAVNDMTTSIQNMITGSCITCMQHTSDTVGGYRNKPCLDCTNAPLQDDQNLQKYVDALDMYKERLAISSSTHSKISGTSITDTTNVERTRGGRSLSQTCRANSICCLTCPNKGSGNGSLLSGTFPLLITDNQGLLELHIAQLQLSTTALFRDGDTSNVSFCVSWEIWNQERASTPILMGPKLNYNSSFVYRIPDLSAFFMFVLNEYVIFQVTIVRQAREEHVAAQAKLCIKDILDYPQNKLHYIAPMNSVAACSLGMNFGQLSLWVRLSCDVQKVDAFKKEQGLHNELRGSKDIARLNMKEIEAKIEATSQDIFEPIRQLSETIVSKNLTEPVSYEPLIQPGPLNSLSLTSDISGSFPLVKLPTPTEFPVVSSLLPKDTRIRSNSMIKVHRTSSILDPIQNDDITTDEEEENDSKGPTPKSKKEGVEIVARTDEPRISGSSRLDEIQADTPSLIEFNSLLQNPLEKDTILIQIVDLSLFENSSIMANDEIVMLYVEYSFLGYRGESMETQSVEKPKSSSQKLTFNFRKKFRVDDRMHGVQRNTLKAMLDESINSNIRFIVISEPVPEETESKECEEVGYASFNIREFGLGDGQKIVSLPVTIQDQSEEIGVLKIFILGFDVIQQCIEENEEDL